jgi:hypothetical protein
MIDIINARIERLGALNIPEIDFGDCVLKVFPFDNADPNFKLPALFSAWQEAFDAMRRQVPLVDGKNLHYVTIDSQWFSTDGFLRREGIHIDGNFCADPNFSYSTWGGIPTPSWAGIYPEKDHEDNWIVNCPWTLPYEVKIPIGQYVSSDKGGILSASSKVGCKAWHGRFAGEVRDSGDYEHMRAELELSDSSVIFGANEVWFMSSDTPHETLMIDKGNRRTLIRLTLHHAYPNEMIVN